MFDDERITWSIDGGGRFFYRPSHRYSVTNVSGWLKVTDERIIHPKFLFHALDSAWRTKTFDYTRKAHPSVIRGEYSVPLPPLEVQREVVRILDTFTDLETELEAELEARQKQYGHYRWNLLQALEDFPTVELDEVAEFFNAKAHERLVTEDGDTALITARFVSTEGQVARYVPHDSVLTPALEGDVALVMSDLPNGRALAKTFYVDADNTYAANQRVCLLRSRDRSHLLPKFLHYVMNRNKQLLRWDSGFDQTHLKKSYIQRVKFSLPPLAEQRRIVQILDRFEALTKDLEVGLPAEIAARREQFEFYRDRLLSFEDLRV